MHSNHLPTSSAHAPLAIKRALTFDQTPALSTSARFFLTAPLFAFLAAILLLWYGPQTLASRWTPITLAITHLLTLGCLSMAMIGALLQILPVVIGITLPSEQLSATVIHTTLTLGTLLLTAALAWSHPALFKIALFFLVSGFIWLLAACTSGFWRAQGSGSTASVSAVRLALAALAVTIILGAILGSSFAWPSALMLPVEQLANLHVLWGLGGWVALLVIGVAYQVIPMFQVTELYPHYLHRGLSKTLFTLLVIWSLIYALDAVSPGSTHVWQGIPSVFILIASILFSVTTIFLLAKRKRPRPDATTLFWATAMASLPCSAVLWFIQSSSPDKPYSLTTGVLFIIGFAYSVISGMLYKIIPFLVWYHLRANSKEPMRALPSVQQLLPDSIAKKQFWLHFISLLLTLSATIMPSELTRTAACTLCASSCWLWINLFRALRQYWLRQEPRLQPPPVSVHHKTDP